MYGAFLSLAQTPDWLGRLGTLVPARTHETAGGRSELMNRETHEARPDAFRTAQRLVLRQDSIDTSNRPALRSDHILRTPAFMQQDTRTPFCVYTTGAGLTTADAHLHRRGPFAARRDNKMQITPAT